MGEPDVATVSAPPRGLAPGKDHLGPIQTWPGACGQDPGGDVLRVTWEAALSGQSGELPHTAGWAWETILLSSCLCLNLWLEPSSSLLVFCEMVCLTGSALWDVLFLVP